MTEPQRGTTPFNGPVEIGLRALVILNEAYPSAHPLQRLVIYDYLIVHSDDVPGGPSGLHPKTPHRGGELLVRRGVLERGLLLYQSRGLIDRKFKSDGVFYCASERSAAFLDTLCASYVDGLRERAKWITSTFDNLSQGRLDRFVREHIGQWGAEFELQSVLWMEESQ